MADSVVAFSDELDGVIRAVMPAKARSRRPTAPGPLEPDLTRTIVEMSSPLLQGPAPVQSAFRRCMSCLEDVHRAYVTAARVRVLPLTVGDLGLMALFASHVHGRWVDGMSMYLLPGNMDSWVAPELTTATDYMRVNVLLARLREGDPFALFAERAQRASTSFEQGEFGDAIVQAAVGAEILLDGLLGLMLWEERDDTAAMAALSRPLAERVRTEYHQRLGGTWDTSRNQVLRRWQREVALPRGRVMHRGWRPSEAEAGAALSAARDLESFLTERIIDRRTKYVRTALLMVGEPGLHRRGMWMGQIPRWMASSKENPDDWLAAYRQWRTAIDSRSN